MNKTNPFAVTLVAIIAVGGCVFYIWDQLETDKIKTAQIEAKDRYERAKMNGDPEPLSAAFPDKYPRPSPTPAVAKAQSTPGFDRYGNRIGK